MEDGEEEEMEEEQEEEEEVEEKEEEEEGEGGNWSLFYNECWRLRVVRRMQLVGFKVWPRQPGGLAATLTECREQFVNLTAWLFFPFLLLNNQEGKTLHSI